MNLLVTRRIGLPIAGGALMFFGGVGPGEFFTNLADWLSLVIAVQPDASLLRGAVALLGGLVIAASIATGPPKDRPTLEAPSGVPLEIRTTDKDLIFYRLRIFNPNTVGASDAHMRVTKSVHGYMPIGFVFNWSTNETEGTRRYCTIPPLSDRYVDICGNGDGYAIVYKPNPSPPPELVPQMYVPTGTHEFEVELSTSTTSIPKADYRIVIEVEQGTASVSFREVLGLAPNPTAPRLPR